VSTKATRNTQVSMRYFGHDMRSIPASLGTGQGRPLGPFAVGPFAGRCRGFGTFAGRRIRLIGPRNRGYSVIVVKDNVEQ